ncbi:MAG TPA: ester cyclase [Solirubrobacteraceae bacterium]|nr:ester cyclase [Solirubrobacteraceae bacterium]
MTTGHSWLHRWFAAGDGGDVDAFDELLHTDVVVHAPMGLSSNGIDAEKQVWREAIAAMPDLRHDIRECWETASGIAARVRVSGTHQGSFGGIEGTGRRFEIDQATFVHLRDGRATEIWEIADTGSLMRQLGRLSTDD